MNDYNEKEEKKGGILSGLSSLFRGGSSVAGGASSGLGSAAGGGLFATKAGIVGLVLGSATIAAGVGVVYNFIGPSSKGVYSPELFQNSYYEEESSKASQERTMSRASTPEASTLDMFREQAKKDGLGGLAAEAGEGGNSAAAQAGVTEDPSASADAGAPGGAPGATDAAAGGSPRLKSSSGFGGAASKMGGGSSGTAIPKMQAGGGLSGGIGQSFAQVNRAGKTSGMTASAAARLSSSPKYSVPNFNKKGAYGQAKYASAMSKKATGYSGAASAGYATEAMTSVGNTGGDVATAETGAGLGGAGVSDGAKLKSSDPSLNKTENSVPEVSEPTAEDPWQSTEDKAMKYMMIAMGLILVAKLLKNWARTNIYAYYALMAVCAAAIAAAAVVVFCGIKMMTTYGQKLMGGVYILTGAMMAMMALSEMGSASDAALSGADAKAGTPAGCLNGKTGFGNSMADMFKGFKGMMTGLFSK